jgi:leucyl/phenylalanyl-tRNA--protein transferase
MSKHTKQPAIVQQLLALYARGQFPMGEEGRREIYVYQPDPRGILPLDGSFHVPDTLAARVRAGRFQIRSDTAFERVMRACARPRPGKEGGETTWITGDLIAMYTALHQAGHAHSVEAWLPGKQGQPVLVGGLYGVHLRGLFAGESMFSRPELGGTDASKVCLVHLVRHLRRRGFTLLDTQFVTPHLAQFGAREVSDAEYQELLAAAMAVTTVWEPFEPAVD